MPTPAQRRKVRNPGRKVTKKKANSYYKKRNLPSGMPIPDVVLPHWSKDSSVRENYAKLGLMLRLNGVAGGKTDALCDHVSINVESLRDNWTELDGGYAGKELDLTLIKNPMVSRIQDNIVEEGIPERDEEGNIIGYKIVQRNMDNIDDMKDDGTAAEVIRRLEEHAASEIKPERHQSEEEVAFIQKCLKKYGNDYKLMAKDLKLNILQLTPAQIRKKVERFLGTK